MKSTKQSKIIATIADIAFIASLIVFVTIIAIYIANIITIHSDFLHKSISYLYTRYNGLSYKDAISSKLGSLELLFMGNLILMIFSVYFSKPFQKFLDKDDFEPDLVLLSFAVIGMFIVICGDIAPIATNSVNASVQQRANKELSKYNTTHVIKSQDFIRKNDNTFVVNNKIYHATDVSYVYKPNSKPQTLIIKYQTNDAAPKAVKAYSTMTIHKDATDNNTVTATIE